MPANPKYLTISPWSRFGKITAAILGSYLVSISLHLALAAWFNKVNMIITAAYSGFIVWVVLMIVAFLFHSAWKAWLTYIVLTATFIGLMLLGQQLHA